MEKWIQYTKKADFAAISKKYGINPVTARVMRNRDVVTDSEIDEYLNGNIDKLVSYLFMKDMDKAITIIADKIANNQKIRIIGDYDIDGICSSFILSDALEKLGADVDIAIPNRITDGYGINERIIEDALMDEVDTIITCDNGIAAIEQINFAKQSGMTVIVTDHHEVPFEVINNEKKYIMSSADAVINPKQIDCKYPFKMLCGASVAYKLVEGLYEKLNKAKSEVIKYLEYAAIATIGDVVDLQGENRIITKYGLDLLRHTKNYGLRALIEENNIEISNISAYHIGFVIGPCLNASGRLDTAKKAYNLLRCQNEIEAHKIANELKTLNDERKEMTLSATKEAAEIAETMSNDKILVIYLQNCHESIAGIIAGRIKEIYHKPVFVLTDAESGIKGSGRSIESYNMFEELIKVKEYLVKFGGHAMAAGVSLDKSNLNAFRIALNQNTTMTDDNLVLVQWIDAMLHFEYINKDMIYDLQKLEPYGKGNEKPMFGEQNVLVEKMYIRGRNRNILKLDLSNENGAIMQGIYFGDVDEMLQNLSDKFGKDEVDASLNGRKNSIKISIIFYPDIDNYNGSEKTQIIIRRMLF